MAYTAVISRIDTRPIPDADNIVLGTCLGYNVIVSKDTESGSLGVFFEAGGALSEEFAVTHDLVRRKNEDGTSAGGYFEENRRVKAVKMRGVKSEGFWMPISCLAYTGADLSKLNVGDQFEELNGHKICFKYITPATARQGNSNRAVKRGETFMFRKQPDIGQLRKELAAIPSGSVVYITEKVHGTSARYGCVLDEVPVPKWRTFLHKFFPWIDVEPAMEWSYLNGSKNVILEENPNYVGYYGAEKFRDNATKGIWLKKGEILYGELVGYTENGTPIMSPQSTKGLKDKNISKRYGDTMVYSYGQKQGECEFYVYRIAMVNEDGFATELSWPQVKARSKELGLKHVPELDSFILENVRPEVDPEYAEGRRLHLLDTARLLTEDSTGCLPSTIDPSHIREGVVVRYESEYGTGFLKNKSFVFGILEGYAKDDPAAIDLEEIS